MNQGRASRAGESWARLNVCARDMPLGLSTGPSVDISQGHWEVNGLRGKPETGSTQFRTSSKNVLVG